jgi:hypothetical protein
MMSVRSKAWAFNRLVLNKGDKVKVRTGQRIWTVILVNGSSAVLEGPKGQLESELIGDLTIVR